MQNILKISQLHVINVLKENKIYTWCTSGGYNLIKLLGILIFVWIYECRLALTVSQNGQDYRRNFNYMTRISISMKLKFVAANNQASRYCHVYIHLENPPYRISPNSQIQIVSVHCSGPWSADYSPIKAMPSNAGPQGKYHLVLTIQPQIASCSSAQHSSWMKSGTTSNEGTFLSLVLQSY